MDLASLKRLIPILKHLVITIGAGLIGVLIYFYIYLPISTNHGESITVPNIVNQHVDDLNDILLSRSLRFEVNIDSSYSPDQEALTVIDQFPMPNSKVKENRKIYVTLNARRPPLVKMPQLVDKSLKIAEITLQSYGLKSGKVEYKPDLGLNVVLQQMYRGRDVLEGEMIPKGSNIDLFIGDGHGNRSFEMFDYTNQPLADAKIALAGQGLSLGDINYVNSPQVEKIVNDSLMTFNIGLGNIVNQAPVAGRIVRLGDLVNLWVHFPDSIATEGSILENQ